MSFETIGPYELTRGDLLAAAFVISFSTGSRATRVKAALFVLVGVMIIVGGLVIGEPLTAAFGLVFLLLVFVIAPAFRTRAGRTEIYLAYSEEGIVADTPNAKVTYKWATVRSATKVGSRLFIMISDGWALVVSDRVTSQDNMERLAATVAQHQSFVAP
ncbi:hypothetical protein U1872_08315 [Sphingomonas sp. RB3P16]|uniref:hypothetical protein n=1 Tax=Parasphingomonas frigoris TaxID=3096163 RepID=UPI002FCA034D